MDVSLETVLKPDELRRLHEAGELAQALDMRLYLAGGCVRDILCAQPYTDWDLAVEGDALYLARKLAARWNARAQIYPRFLTATLKPPGGPECDLATARTEKYPYPGALPVVTPASMSDDLWRRDFSVNALVVSLCPDDWGHLLDPTGGFDDLQTRQLRVLHERSFFDDATRLVRAINYEQRLGFKIEAWTAVWFKEALGADILKTVSHERLATASIYAMQGPAGPEFLRRVEELGLLEALQIQLPNLSRVMSEVRWLLDSLAQAYRTSENRLIACLAGLLTAEADVKCLGEILCLKREQKKSLKMAQRRWQHFTETSPANITPEYLRELLDGTDFYTIAFFWLQSDDSSLRPDLLRYWYHSSTENN